MLTIAHRGQEILSTNYWDTPHAKSGYFFLSWNAGAGRLLVPDNQVEEISDMRSARSVIVSQGRAPAFGGREMLELLFEDDSDCPYCVHIDMRQMDRRLRETDQRGGFSLAVWTRRGMQLRLPARFRMVARIPCLKPWSDS